MFSDIDRKINILNSELSKLDTYIINREKYDHEYIQDELFKINKILLVLKLTMGQIKIKYENNDLVQERLNEYETRTKFFSENIKDIREFTNSRNIRKQKKSINLLTIINMIFLPLGFLTGYFGMNFASMGNPDIKKGIFSIKHGQIFAWSLFAITGIIVTIITVKNM